MLTYFPIQNILSQELYFFSVYQLKAHKNKNLHISPLASKALSLWEDAEKMLLSTRSLEKISYALEVEAYYLQVCEKMISQNRRNDAYVLKALLHDCIIAIPVIALSIVLISKIEVLSPTIEKKKNNGKMRNANPFLYAMH